MPALTGWRRRQWLQHCSVGLGLTLAAGPGSVLAQGSAVAKPAQGSGARRPRRLLVVGDSLSAEYGLARGSGWVALLDKQLQGRQPPVQVVNASISGDTTSGGRSRLPALLKQHRPTHVVVELGGNDALRGLPMAQTRANLVAMARAAKAAGAQVMLVGMQLPPNYGRRYGEQFAALFAEVAQAEGAALVPFLLAGVADGPDADGMFQPDRIHPLAKAHPLMLANVWRVMAGWLA